MRASSGCLTPDAYPVDANRRGGLARQPNLTTPHLRDRLTPPKAKAPVYPGP